MLIYPDPSNGPLGHVPVAMQERRFLELRAHLAEQGIQIVDGNETVVVLNLRNLAAANGTIARGQQALYAALESLNTVRVDCEPQDVQYCCGNNVLSHGVARGLEAGVPTLVQLLTAIQPDELFANLERATDFICNDRFVDNDGVQEQLNRGAEDDLYRAGLIAAPIKYVEPPDPYALNANTCWEPADVLPWRSPFDPDEV